MELFVFNFALGEDKVASQLVAEYESCVFPQKCQNSMEMAQCLTSWLFQASWTISVKLHHFLKCGQTSKKQ